jgi:IMP dehydrogenase
MHEALTFDDCQLEPNYSEVESRNDCKTTSQLTKNYAIRIPLVAAPMDTVCNALMMEQLAVLGGVGCLHRFLSIEEQCKIVKQVSKIHIQTGAPLNCKYRSNRGLSGTGRTAI